MDGELFDAMMTGGESAALVVSEKYQSIFGKENYFYEIQNHGLEIQKKWGTTRRYRPGIMQWIPVYIGNKYAEKLEIDKRRC